MKNAFIVLFILASILTINTTVYASDNSTDNQADIIEQLKINNAQLEKQNSILQEMNQRQLDMRKDENIRRYGTVDPVTGAARNSECFIATAAYGSELDPKLDILRHYRDRELITNPTGKWAVETYYQLSPPIADFIRDKDWLRSIIRFMLDPIINSLAEKYTN